MVIVIIVAIAVAAAALALAALYVVPRLARRRVVFETTPDRPCAFGYRMAWLAVRARDPSLVVTALGIARAEPANWRTGVGVVYDDELGGARVFVSPSVNGWVFVVARALPRPQGTAIVDRFTPLLVDLGRTFVEVQFYLTEPATDSHAWARLIDGRLVRAFAITEDGVVLNTGRPTKEERALGLRLFELRGVKGRRGDAGGELLLYPTEEHVMRLASRWSIDPTTLGTASAEVNLGLVGLVPADWAPASVRSAA